MKKACLLLIALAALSACTNPPKDLKSPCVGAEGSPCDRRAPANQDLV